ENVREYGGPGDDSPPYDLQPGGTMRLLSGGLSMERPIFGIFCDVAAARPDAVALDDGAARITYGQCRRMASALARAISDQLPQDAPFAIALQDGLRFPVTILAGFCCGRPYVPLDVDGPDLPNKHVIEHAGVRAIVVDRQTSDAARRLAPNLPQI